MCLPLVRQFAPRILLLAAMPLLVMQVSAGDAPSAAPLQSSKSDDQANARQLEKLPKEDRAALNIVVGRPPAEFTADLKWAQGQPLTWKQLHGKIVVIQSWTSGNEAGRKWPSRLAETLKDASEKDLVLIALHTPDNANNAEAFIKRQSLPANVTAVIDPTGEFCDALGIYKLPVNLVIDRAGVVRTAGLTPAGLKQYVEKLIAEPFDPAAASKPSTPAPKAKSPAKFPPVTGTISQAIDMRGKPAPEFAVSEWLTDQPDLAGKVVVIDFWATWCGPCVAAIPHMNELAQHFGDKVQCVGISDESRSDFEAGAKRRKLTAASFKYAVALDPSRSMSGALSIRAIPHCIVMSSDWVVRWQGHPADLSIKTLQTIVEANASIPESETKAASPKPRWRKA